MSNEIEEHVNQICDRAKHELVALLLSVPPTVKESVPLPEWMTARQLAEYWQLYVDDEPATAGIMKWARRSPDEFPLPHARMGDMTRFRREDADRWALEEASRNAVKKRPQAVRLSNNGSRLSRKGHDIARRSV